MLLNTEVMKAQVRTYWAKKAEVFFSRLERERELDTRVNVQEPKEFDDVEFNVEAFFKSESDKIMKRTPRPDIKVMGGGRHTGQVFAQKKELFELAKKANVDKTKIYLVGDKKVILAKYRDLIKKFPDVFIYSNHSGSGFSFRGDIQDETFVDQRSRDLFKELIKDMTDVDLSNYVDSKTTIV